ncbi:MAG: insulinase family protein, partial [Hymenobacteraceae bacterium]|nr:insulinase family protein [Hymenobacteraceae bacterium]
MNKSFALAALASAFAFSQCRAPQPAASTPPPAAPVAATPPPPPAPKQYKFQQVPGDPLQARIYTLDNGLTVYLSDYKNAPRIQTYIAVRAGSKNDPHTATGLAHYLEHIMFKGTSKMGSKDWAQEKPQLDKIEALYNVYRTKTDPAERKRLYHQIDSVSGVAATFAVANEYDKLMGIIGAKGTNAHTSVEETVYQEDIPANEVQRWAEVQAERFREITPRLFHTELEAVYEEKNRGLDSDGEKQFETLLASLFPTHEYGTQSTIGTIEHLKNPSITEIKKYFDAYYVPNNVAITMSGDLDYDQTIRIIDAQFGSWKPSAKLPVYTPAVEVPLTATVRKTVIGPEAESLLMGYRLPGQLHPDAMALRMVDRLLGNGRAGLIDLNINQQQKLLSAYSGTFDANDYSIEYVAASLRAGQTMAQAEALLLAEIEKVKKGDFPDWLMQAIVTNEKLDHQRAYERNTARASEMYDSFIAHQNWADAVSEDDRFGRVTKAQVMAAATKYFGPGYAIVYKRTGKDPNAQKVDKPAITPVPVNRGTNSGYARQIMDEKASAIQPVFLDYQKDIMQGKTATAMPVLTTRNTENKLFSLNYIIEAGDNNDPRLGLAAQYLKFLGDDRHDAAQLQQEFYKIGCSFDVSVSGDQTTLNLSGPDESFAAGAALFDHFLRNPRPDAEALKKLVASELKNRKDAKLDKGTILQGALVNYAKYGPRNPFTNIVKEKDLKTLKPQDLLAQIKRVLGYEYRVFYYGPRPLDNLTQALDEVHPATTKLVAAPPVKEFKELPLDKPEVLWADYDMVQAELIFLTRAGQYDKQLVPTVRLYNEYFGGGMGSIVFQELRESKALAYSTYSSYGTASKTGRSAYIQSYIGAQADKLADAMVGMEGLLNEMPLDEGSFANARTAVRANVASERITRENILFAYVRAR